MRSVAVAIGLSLSAQPALAADPWFVRADCMEATRLTYAARLDQAKARAAALLASKDLDARACGIWLSVGVTEMEIALFDDEERLLARMAKELDAMHSFGSEHGHVAQRFEDLVIEATLRRVHLEVRRGERSAAIRAVEQAQKLMEKRRRVPTGTPTYFYAEGVANLALTHAAWPVRTILKLVGVEGDEERGRKAMKKLLERESVYRPEATCVTRSFALDSAEALGAPLEYSERMYTSFPENPQMAFDVANDLREANRCREVPAKLARFSGKISRDPGAFSEKVRRKLEGILEACAER
jgi:hypothetical protein